MTYWNNAKQICLLFMGFAFHMSKILIKTLILSADCVHSVMSSTTRSLNNYYVEYDLLLSFMCYLMCYAEEDISKCKVIKNSYLSN